MKIALVQTNPVIGDFARNLQRVLDRVDTARRAGCDLVVFPELTLCGYPPQDLLERTAFLDAHDRALAELIHRLEGITCIVGVLERRTGPGKPLYNAAFVLGKDRILFRARKQLLPSYDVFDETRYFQPGEVSTIFPLAGLHCGLTVCEDIWWSSQAYPTNPLKDLVLGAVVPDCLINISASPYHYGKLAERQEIFGRLCRDNNLPLLYVNQVGGQDGLIFDGHSLCLDACGRTRAVARGFAEDLLIVDSDDWHRPGPDQPLTDSVAHVHEALVLGVRDYLHKSGFRRAVLGLSGGIDSALVLAIAVDALGADKVHTVMMPSPYTADISWIDARDMAERVGVRYDEISIAPQFEAFKAALAPAFAGRAEDTTEENLQARIRGTLLMGLSNKFGSVVLTTGNKSEMSTGYCTLYGDMAGGFAVIKDVLKTEVFALARWRNANDPFGTGLDPIPDRIITRPPSAELRPDQKDQDSLPAYEVLDAIVRRYMENNESIASIVADGYASADVERVTRLIQINEYKRRQAPVGPRLTRRSFGKDWRYPITNRFRA